LKAFNFSASVFIELGVDIAGRGLMAARVTFPIELDRRNMDETLPVLGYENIFTESTKEINNIRGSSKLGADVLVIDEVMVLGDSFLGSDFEVVEGVSEGDRGRNFSIFGSFLVWAIKGLYEGACVEMLMVQGIQLGKGLGGLEMVDHKWEEVVENVG
jgi:hypothetical protein